MPTAVSSLAEATNFHDAYDRVGWYETDDSRIPYFNPADSTTAFLPGEPFVMEWGGQQIVVMAQDIIRPGEIGMVIRYFTASFPCNFSANVVMGTDCWWDIDNDVVSLNADVTNGILLGQASYPISSKPKALSAPTVDAGSPKQVIVAGTSSTRVMVVSAPAEGALTKGTVTAY